jgi:hypothetical protein
MGWVSLGGFPQCPLLGEELDPRREVISMGWVSLGGFPQCPLLGEERDPRREVI